MLPNKQILQQTHQLIKSYIHRTPLLQNEFLTRLVGCKELQFKAEHLQRVGAFKARGACNAILNTNAKIVCTSSSGNHGAAVALMAQQANKQAIIVMPNNSAKVKIDAVNRYYGQVVFCENSTMAREQTSQSVIQYCGAKLIHPYNDYYVIAGQATAAMEIYEDLKDLDYLLVPIGGGGLASGTLLATQYFSPSTKVIGVEPLLASDAKISIETGIIQAQMPPVTIADGLRTSLGDKTFDVISKSIHDIITVDESEMIRATFILWRTLKAFVEVSSGTVLAALLQQQDRFKGKKVAAILSGGNVDIEALSPFLKEYNDCL